MGITEAATGLETSSAPTHPRRFSFMLTTPGQQSTLGPLH